MVSKTNGLADQQLPVLTDRGSETIPYGSTSKRMEALRPGNRYDIVRPRAEMHGRKAVAKHSEFRPTHVDEIIFELPEDAFLQARIRRINELMVAGMREVIQTVDVTVEGALMRRWYKDAEAVYDAQGNMIVWEPEMAVA